MVATGGTASAASKLVEISKGSVAGFIFVINLFDLGGSDYLINKGYKVENLLEFPGHWSFSFYNPINDIYYINQNTVKHEH